MKKKIIFGIVGIVLITFSIFSVNMSTNNGDISLQNIELMTQANAENPYLIYCTYYCQPGGDVCSLHVGFNDGTTGWIHCYTMYF